MVVVTFTHTPRLNYAPFGNSRLVRFTVFETSRKAGVFDFFGFDLRDFRTSWLTVGIYESLKKLPVWQLDNTELSYKISSDASRAFLYAKNCAN